MPVKLQTPPNLPDGETCRTMKIPSSYYWLGIFNSALLEMLNPYNWEQVNDTDLTIDETIALCKSIIDEYWATEGCGIGESCLMPDGRRVLRLNEFGNVQELADGVWQPPTGDYAPPSVPVRSGGTPYSRKCLAAANAENVLHQTYEIVTDGITAELAADEIILLVVEGLILYLGAWIGFVAPALVVLAIAALYAFIEIAQYMTIDLWDEEFSAALLCVLMNCATDTAGVVTFDFQCVHDGLAASTDVLDPEALTHIRLFGQVAFMLSIIGAEGLNLAGATTAIETANCDDCGDWCYTFHFEISAEGWVVPAFYASAAEYVSGEGFKPVTGGITAAGKEFGIAVFIRSIGLRWQPSMDGNYRRLFHKFDGAISDGGSTETVVGGDMVWGFEVNDYHTSVEFLLQNGTPNSSYPLDYAIYQVTINGSGENPFGEPNCEEEE